MSMTINASQLMMQMGQMKLQAQSPSMLENNPLRINNNALNEVNKAEPKKVNFSDLLSGAVDNVNALQKQSGALKKDFVMGKEGVDLVQVMIASNKAGVAFSALLETRNQLLKVYNEVKRTRV